MEVQIEFGLEIWIDIFFFLSLTVKEESSRGSGVETPRGEENKHREAESSGAETAEELNHSR